jgi:hypothetical protein
MDTKQAIIDHITYLKGWYCAECKSCNCNTCNTSVNLENAKKQLLNLM